MMLDKIVSKTQERLIALKRQKSPEEIMNEASAMNVSKDFPFEKALRSPGISFICEVKKASPSKGVIAEDFPYVQIAKDYETAGANALSVLTEPDFFLGRNEYLKEISENVSIPILRKDFTIDRYQIYESKIIGASAVLLICAILDEDTLPEYIALAHELGLSTLVEAHTQKEVYKALDAGARMIGVNNRDLKTFEVDITSSIRLKPLVPENITFVSESGIRNRSDIEALEKVNIDAVLIGETLMRSDNKKEKIRILRGE